jgi:hypothetical protein
MRLCKIFFSHPSLVFYFLPNLTYTTKTERADRWETTKSKPPRLANQNLRSTVKSYLLHSSLAGVKGDFR